MKVVIVFLMFFALYNCRGAGVTPVEVDGFSILMPCESEMNVDSASAKKVIKEYICLAEEVTYTFRITKFDNGMYHSDSLKNLDFDLDYSQRYFANNGKVDLTGLVLKTVDGYPGKEFQFLYKFEDKLDFRRAFIVKNFLVEMIYSGPKSKLFHKDIGKYFDSFQLPGFTPNPVPYIDFPSEEEIESRPFSVDFGGETTQEIQANETEYGKVATVMEMSEFNPSVEKGLIVLAVLYGDFPSTLTKESKVGIFENHRNKQEMTFPNFSWIEKGALENDRAVLKFEYTINGVYVVDSREFFFDGDRMYVVIGTAKKDSYPNDKIDDFIAQFKLKNGKG